MSVFPQPPASAVKYLLTEAGSPSSDLTAAHLEHGFGCGSARAPDGIVGVELVVWIGSITSIAGGRSRPNAPRHECREILAPVRASRVLKCRVVSYLHAAL